MGPEYLLQGPNIPLRHPGYPPQSPELPEPEQHKGFPPRGPSGHQHEVGAPLFPSVLLGSTLASCPRPPLFPGIHKFIMDTCNMSRQHCWPRSSRSKDDHIEIPPPWLPSTAGQKSPTKTLLGQAAWQYVQISAETLYCHPLTKSVPNAPQLKAAE